MLELLAALWLAASVPSAGHQHGLDLYKQKDYASAIAALEQAAQTESPGSLEFRESALLIGQSYFMLARAPKAIPWLEKLPEVNEANYMLGYAYLQNAQPDKSEAAFARLFGLKPESAAAHATAAQMMLKKEFQDQAATEAAKALSLDPNVARAHYLLGEIAISHGDLDGAIGHLDQEIAVDPGYSMAWYRLGDAYVRGEHWASAIPNLQRAVWLDPNFSGPFILLGKCYFKERNFSNAEGMLRAALTLDPRNREATYLLGQTLLATGRAEEAKAILEKLKAPPN